MIGRADTTQSLQFMIVKPRLVQNRLLISFILEHLVYIVHCDASIRYPSNRKYFLQVMWSLNGLSSHDFQHTTSLRSTWKNGRLLMKTNTMKVQSTAKDVWNGVQKCLNDERGEHRKYHTFGSEARILGLVFTFSTWRLELALTQTIQNTLDSSQWNGMRFVPYYSSRLYACKLVCFCWLWIFKTQSLNSNWKLSFRNLAACAPFWKINPK